MARLKAGDLTGKQQLFVAHYSEHHCAKSAAIAAGYSTKSAESIGSMLLKNPRISAKLIQLAAKQLARLEISSDIIIQRIAKIALAEPGAKRSDILKACELLGRHYKLFSDSLEITANSSAPQVVLTMPSNGSEAPALLPDVVSDKSHYVNQPSGLTALPDANGEPEKSMLQEKADLTSAQTEQEKPISAKSAKIFSVKNRKTKQIGG